jgi:hypothetical protein
MACPIPRRSQRIERVDRPAGTTQGRDQQTTVGFDGDWDLVVMGVASLSQQAKQVGETGSVGGDLAARQHIACFIDDRDIMAGFAPIDATEGSSSSSSVSAVAAHREPLRGYPAT